PNGITFNYLAFDCICTKNGNNIQNLNYTSRKQYVDLIEKNLKNPIINVSYKKTREITSPESFFSLSQEFLNERSNLWYKEDGLMYIPIDTIYNPKSQLH